MVSKDKTCGGTIRLARTFPHSKAKELLSLLQGVLFADEAMDGNPTWNPDKELGASELSDFVNLFSEFGLAPSTEMPRVEPPKKVVRKKSSKRQSCWFRKAFQDESR